MKTKGEAFSYKDTLNLPRTDFPIRAQASVDDQALVDRWHQEDLYQKSFVCNEGKQAFIIIDGPPYANGMIHLGHAYNKILKDIVAKSQRMLGKHVPIVPGWDCHGLPIELKVSQENPSADRNELKKFCRSYAQKWIDAQIPDFKRLGVLMNWDSPYKTMDFEYEAETVRCFGQLVEHGFIERKNKTVPWCYSCQTVLATAEIEYQDRKDPSIYVLFALEDTSVNVLFPSLNSTIYMVVWTTTPWCLLFNRALLIHPDTEYVALNVHEKIIVIAAALADSFCALLDVKKNVVASFHSRDITSGTMYARNPLVSGLRVPLFKDISVDLSVGTACVNNAPGTGPEDYEIGLKNGIEIYSPVGPDGKMMFGIDPEELQGMIVDDVQIWVLKRLAQLGLLIHKTSLRHSYPHCWRCHKGLIFRATKQWFCNLQHNNLKEKTLNAINSIHMLPETSDNRFKATIASRSEWCLSRQRVWGTPIPALLCNNCDYVYCTKAFIDRVAEGIAQRGVEFWDTVDQAILLDGSIQCPQCSSTSFTKEQDILDVWFDAGVGHTAVLKKMKSQQFPADLFLEGKDQHRGYFQSSLLTSMALYDQSCMNAIVTHGFTVDESGRKMSKSIGNVVSPQDMIAEIGTDCLRLWAASIDLSGEAIVSETLIKNIQEVFRKIRNTARFLLSNLYDYNHETDVLPVSSLQAIDRYALRVLIDTQKKVIDAYQQYNFTGVAHLLGDYCTVELSSFYVDIVKDRLYVEQASGIKRRSAQTVCYYILDGLTKMMAPILSFVAEQISDHYQKNKKESIHLQQYLDVSEIDRQLKMVSDTSIYTLWSLLKQIRCAVLKAIEAERAAQLIKHSLEAKIILYIDKEATWYQDWLSALLFITTDIQTVPEFFSEFFIVSEVTFVDNQSNTKPLNFDGLWGSVCRAEGEKCPRCWQWKRTQHEHGLCDRCVIIVHH